MHLSENIHPGGPNCILCPDTPNGPQLHWDDYDCRIANHMPPQFLPFTIIIFLICLFF